MTEQRYTTWVIESPAGTYLDIDPGTQHIPVSFSWGYSDSALRFINKKQALDFYDLIYHLQPHIFGFQDTLGSVRFTEQIKNEYRWEDL